MLNYAARFILSLIRFVRPEIFSKIEAVPISPNSFENKSRESFLRFFNLAISSAKNCPPFSLILFPKRISFNLVISVTFDKLADKETSPASDNLLLIKIQLSNLFFQELIRNLIHFSLNFVFLLCEI